MATVRSQWRWLAPVTVFHGAGVRAPVHVAWHGTVDRVDALDLFPCPCRVGLVPVTMNTVTVTC